MEIPKAFMSRRTLLGAAGAGAAALALSACGGGSTGTGAGSSSGPLQFWSNHPGSSKDMELAIINEWNAANDIQVELIDAGASYEELAQKFNAALSGGELPDVIVASDVTWFNFALNEATTPLDEIWT